MQNKPSVTFQFANGVQKQYFDPTPVAAPLPSFNPTVESLELAAQEAQEVEVVAPEAPAAVDDGQEDAPVGQEATDPASESVASAPEEPAQEPAQEAQPEVVETKVAKNTSK